MVLQEGESYDQIFADIERVIMPGVSCIITLHFDGKFIKKDESEYFALVCIYVSGTTVRMFTYPLHLNLHHLLSVNSGRTT